MMAPLPEQGVSIKVSTGSGTLTATDSIILSAATSTNSAAQNIQLEFTNANFDGNALVDGFYRPRWWIVNQPTLQDVDVFGAYSVTPLTGTTPISGGASIPKQYPEISNIDKTTYWDNTTRILEFGAIQLQCGADNQAWNYLQVDTADALLVYEWDRASTSTLNSEMVVSESDTLFTMSQVDLYMEDEIQIDGTTYRYEYLVGYCLDEDFSLALGKEVASLVKGKPSATIVEMYTTINAAVTGTLSTFDPKIMQLAMSIPPMTENNYIKFQEKNVQRPIQYRKYRLEWTTNGGHRVQMLIPKGAIKFTGDYTPGANEISKYAFELKPWVNRCNRNVYTLQISNVPKQRATLCVKIISTVTP